MLRTSGKPLLSAWLFLTACATGGSPPAPGPLSVRHEGQESHTTALLIAVSAVSDSVAWVSGAQGTWLRTVDGGSTWQGGRVADADSLQFRDVYALDASRAWLLSIGPGAGSRIYQTSDGGAHWATQFTNADPDAFFDCLDFWEARRGIVVGDAQEGRTGLLLTNDGGVHWTRVPASSAPEASAGEGSFAASGTCLVTRPAGRAWIVAADSLRSRVLRSTDYGRTWASSLLPLTTRAGAGAQSVAFRDATHGIALAGGNTARLGDDNVAVTEDGGATWIRRGRLPMASGAWGGVYVPGTTRPAVVAVGPAGLAWSGDDGTTWISIDTLNYWSVGFASPRAGWAVGAKGRITRLSGF